MTGQLGFALTVAVVSGVATGVLAPVAPTDAFAGALAAGSALVAAEARAWRVPLLVAAAFFAATAHGAVARDRALSPPLGRWFDTVAASAADRAGDVVHLDGTIVLDAQPSVGGVRVMIDVERVRDGPGWRHARGRVQATVAGAAAPGAMREWTAGRRIRAPATLRRPAAAQNPGGPGLRWQALQRPFDLAASIKSAALVDVDAASWWHEAAARVRRHVRTSLSASIASHDPAAAGIVTAVLIGDRAGLADDVERRLQAAGTYHVIAISGGNVALLTALVILVVRQLVRSARLASVVTMAAIMAYGGIVGGDPSVARAVTAACVYVGAGLVGLTPRTLNVLSVVALGVVVVDPLTVVDVGAWLSFGATLGIVLVAERIARRLRPAAARSRDPAWRATLSGAAAGLLASGVALVAATVAAELALAPIAAAVFSRVGVAGIALNVVAIPAMAVVQVGGALTVAFAGWWDPGAALAAGAARFGANVLVGSTGLLDVAPWLSWRVPPTPFGWTIVYYLAWGICLLPIARGLVRRLAATAAVSSLVIIVTAPGVGRAAPPAGHLRLAVLDVGQGDSLIVQFPSGHSMIVDTGGTAGSFDVGGRVVTPAAWRLGVRRLDWLVITHGDLDHLGGAAAVAGDLDPREVWEGVPVPRNRDLTSLRTEARLGRRVWRTVRDGHAMEVGGVTLDVLHPPAPEWERQKIRNDDSIVLRLRYGDVEVLLTGDAGAEFERRWSDEGDAAPVRVMKVGHHGSRTSSSEVFLSRYRPTVALISAGRANLFGHPAPEVLERLQRVGAEIFRTDRDGAVIIETDGQSVEVRTLRGAHWTLRVVWTSS
jgi:competence protein ComEC